MGDNIEVPREGAADWTLELAEMLILKDLPTGVIVGSAVIERCDRMEDGGWQIEDRESTMEDGTSSPSSILDSPSSLFRWHLAHVERAKRLRKPKGHPQPVWFRPFD